MKSTLPKPLHLLAHKPMLGYVVEAYRAAGAREIVLVVGPDDTLTAPLFPDCTIAVQTEQKGTGHAALVGYNALTQTVDKVIVALGDQPFVQVDTIKNTLQQPDVVSVVAMRPEDPARYGRLVTDATGALLRIVEYKDASEAERSISLCNAFPIALHASKAKELLSAITCENAAGEYYFTDVITLANDKGYRCGYLEAPVAEAVAANTREELAALEAIVQQQLRRKHMLNGVTLMAPETVYFAHDTQIESDVIIEPHVFFGPDVRIASGARIKAFSHIEGAHIQAGAHVGPFARLRPGTLLGPETRVGNFVEIKKSTIGAGTKINHLSYIGDSVVGTKTNIGAGTITCNYDGFGKYTTTIGNNVFLGSNSVIVAPVTIHSDAMTAAGSVITKDVEAEALAISRAEQKNKPGWAALFRTRKQSQKKDK